jgi:chemotaxis protein MotB
MVNGFPAVVLDTDVLFASGKATLNNSAKAALRRVASMVQTKYPTAEVGVAGHTDRQPIVHSKKKFKTNWELSAARALNVLHFMIDSGIDPERIHALAYGEYRPAVPDTGKKGERQNRRVEILLMGLR